MMGTGRKQVMINLPSFPMMNSSKLQLSAEELAMVQDSQWLLTKNSIMLKAYELFGDCAGWLQVALPQIFDADDPVLSVSPKISRGENYKGLPYVMLDYPRLFGKENTFAIRTMFWWGHFISCTLHLRGIYHKKYISSILHLAQELGSDGFQVCIGEDEWRHDFEPANYISIDGLTTESLSAILSGSDFLKIAVPLPLERWNEAKEILPRFYQRLLSVADISYRAGGKDL